jgi:hypothetical protein
MRDYFIKAVNYHKKNCSESLDEVANSKSVKELKVALSKTSLSKIMKENLVLMFNWGEDWDLHGDDDIHYYDDEHVGIGPSDPRYISGMGGNDVPWF